MSELSAREVAHQLWDAVMEVYEWADKHGIRMVGTDTDWFEDYCQALVDGEEFYDRAVVGRRFEVLVERLRQRAEEVDRERGNRQ